MAIILDGSTGIISPALDITTPMTIIDGGTGLSTVGTSGNVLTSNGTSWVSSAPSVTNVSGGVAGSVHYQSATSTTAMTAASTVAGQVLTTSTAGGAPTWVTLPVTFTTKQSFTGSVNNTALSLTNAVEPITVSATAATGTINIDATTQSILYYTTASTANFTINVRANATVALNTIMNIGETISLTFLNTNTGTAYYQTAFQVDSAVIVPKWSGGTAPTAGNASAIDIYSYTIIKTANATFTVLASVVKFA